MCRWTPLSDGPRMARQLLLQPGDTSAAAMAVGAEKTAARAARRAAPPSRCALVSGACSLEPQHALSVTVFVVAGGEALINHAWFG